MNVIDKAIIGFFMGVSIGVVLLCIAFALWALYEDLKGL